MTLSVTRARLRQALGPLGDAMNDGQIYVTLTRLEKAGLVASEQAAGLPDRPDRKMYALTPAGQQRVASWLAEVSWPRPDLAEFHLKLVAAAAAGLADPLAIVDAQRRELPRRLRDAQRGASSELDNPRIDRINEMMLVITVMLVALAAVNTIFITWATVLDARRSSALARARRDPPAGQRRTVSSTGASRTGRRHTRHPRRHLPVQGLATRSAHRPAAMVAARRAAGDSARGRRAHRHPSPHRRPPPRSRDPSIRTCLILDVPRPAHDGPRRVAGRTGPLCSG